MLQTPFAVTNQNWNVSNQGLNHITWNCVFKQGKSIAQNNHNLINPLDGSGEI